ncbi:MAG TPA: hypothetical protein VGW38_22810, partial [Chloroflexota bacterium]|nr:hypothetical protein [Chloroflexota bacterium]
MADNRKQTPIPSFSNARISRRGLVAGAGALGMASALHIPSVAARQDQQFSGKIRFQAGHYTP